MGVLNCYRTNCDEIMCQTYVDDVGYICRECQNEFEDYMSRLDVGDLNEYTIKDNLKTFMDTEKGSKKIHPPMTISEFFEKYDY
jgi:hypothetical protein